MAKALTKPRLVLLLLVPITFPVLCSALLYPLDLIARLLPNRALAISLHWGAVVFALTGSVFVHVKMWRSMQPPT